MLLIFTHYAETILYIYKNIEIVTSQLLKHQLYYYIHHIYPAVEKQNRLTICSCAC